MVVWRNSNSVSGWPYLVNILQQRNFISNKLNNGQTVVNVHRSLLNSKEYGQTVVNVVSLVFAEFKLVV